MSARSMDAYHEILRTLNETEAKLFSYLDRGEYKAEDLARWTHMNIITARARLSEMFDKGIIAQIPTGEYYATHKDDVEDVQGGRLEAKFQKWIKLGLKHDWHFRYDVFIKHGKPPLPEDYE